jgi:hypothetical protein
MGLISAGTTIFDAGVVNNTGNMILVSATTLSSAASSIDFTLSSYKEYQFYLVNIHPASSSKFSVNFSVDSGSNYNVTKTNTVVNVQHDEADSYAEMAYAANDDLAQSTAFASLTAGSTGTDNDSNLGGYLKLFNPSSTTFVKHFIVAANHSAGAATNYSFMAGYANTTSALTNIRFQMSSGNIDAGTILMYGIN